jgi:hypothetical protein
MFSSSKFANGEPCRWHGRHHDNRRSKSLHLLHRSINYFRFLICLLRFVLGPGGLREAPGGPGKAHGELWGAPRGSPDPPGPGSTKHKNPYFCRARLSGPVYMQPHALEGIRESRPIPKYIEKVMENRAVALQWCGFDFHHFFNALGGWAGTAGSLLVRGCKDPGLPTSCANLQKGTIASDALASLSVSTEVSLPAGDGAKQH